jgi:enoyl-[acyl-carrier-protein] reductase (NADH)
LGALQNVTAKFLTRIASSVKDVKSEVQEVAMKLMVMLLKGGFLDGDEIDDTIWDQVNECALSARAVSIYSLIMILIKFLC